jgi:hypothetical protein
MSMLADDTSEDTERIIPPYLFCDDRVALALHLKLDPHAIHCPECGASRETSCLHSNACIESGDFDVAPARPAPEGAEIAAFLRALRPGLFGWLCRWVAPLAARLSTACLGPREVSEDDAARRVPDRSTTPGTVVAPAP